MKAGQPSETTTKASYESVSFFSFESEKKNKQTNNKITTPSPTCLSVCTQLKVSEQKFSFVNK